MILIHPGNAETKKILGSGTTVNKDVDILDSFLDLGRNIIPGNIFQASMETAITRHSQENDTVIKTVEYREGTNTLGIICFCLAFGTVLGSLGEKGKPLIEVFRVIDEVIMRLVMIVMYVSPIGISSIIAAKILGILLVVKVTQESH